MAEGVELATAYLTLIPSLRNAGKTIESQLAGVDVKKAGETLGKNLGASMSDGFSQSGANGINSALSRISSTASTAGKSLQAAGKSLSDAGKSLSDTGDKLTTGITLPLAAAATGVGAFALSTASAAETSEMAFTTMLGSAEAARDMLDELASFAAHTPFELSGLTTVTQQLLAYGFTAQDVIPMLTAVGDATAALGTGQAGIEAVTRALGQMQTRGKVSAEEMLQLTEAGIPAWEYLARAIGTDTAGAMAAVSDGAVDAQTGIDALTKGMEEDFGGMMEKQSTTVAGLMSNLSDAIQRPFMELKDSGAYREFANALGEIIESAEPFVESLLPHMENALSTVSDVLGVAADAMDSFSNMSYSSQKQLLTLVTAAAAAGPAMSVLGRGVQGIGTILTGVGKASETFSKLLGKIPTSASKAAAATTAVTDAATDAAGGVTGAATAASGLGASLATLGAAAAAAGVVAIVGAIAQNAADAAAHQQLLSEATMTTDQILSQASLSASSYGESLALVADTSEPALQSLAALNQSAVDTLADAQTQSAVLDNYVSTIEQLANQSNLTAVEQQQLAQAVEGYNEITGSSVEITDAANGKLSEGTETVRANAEAWKQNAEAQAYQNVATQYLEEQISLEQQLADSKDKLNSMREREQELIDKGSDRTWEESQELNDLQFQIRDQEQAVSDLSEAYDTASDNAENMSNSAAAAAANMSGPLKDALMGLAPEIQDAGLNIATALQAGIDSGSINAETAAAMMSSGIVEQVNRLPSGMQAAGATAVANLATAVQNGQISSQQAAQILTAAINGEVSTLPPELQAYGQQAATDMGISLENGAPTVLSASQTLANSASSKISQIPGVASILGKTGGSNFAGGISSQRGNVSSAASSLSSAASGMGNGNSWTWGSHMAGNFAAGLRSGIGKVASAASALASQAAAYLKHSTPKLGPLADDDVWGLHLAQNLAAGMEAGEGAVKSAAYGLAGAVSFGASTEFSAASGSSDAAGVLALLERIVRELEAIYGVIPEGMDSRTFGRAVRKAAYV